MFLEKFNEPPKQIDLIEDSVEAIFSGQTLTDWKDEDIFVSYIAQIEIDEDTYRAFLSRSLSLGELSAKEYFKQYVDAFADSADARNLQKTKTFKNKTAAAQAETYLERFYVYAHSVEKEKIFYFAMVYQQTTVIITAPADNKAQKDFLGYDWSNRKGNEGIQIITPGGKMYDDADRQKEGTLAHAIRQSFDNIVPYFTADKTDYCSVVNTKDMLDYSRSSFNKALSLTANRKIEYSSKYELVPLRQVADVSKGTAITSADVIQGDYKVVAGGVDFAYMHNKYNREENIVTVSASGANAGFVNFWAEKIFASDCSTVQAKDPVTTKWVYYYLKLIQGQIYEILQKGSGQPHVYPDDIKLIPIPNIPVDIQKAIVDECETLESEAKSIQESIQNKKLDIDAVFESLDSETKGITKYSLANSEKFSVSIGQRVLNKDLVNNGAVAVFSANVFEPFGYIDKLLITDFSFDSVLWGIDGDWLVNFMPKDKQFYPTDHCGVLRCKTEEVNPRYLTHILEVEGKKMGFSRTYRASIDRIQGISFYVPDITKQNEAAEKVQELEEQIAEAEKQLETIQSRTAEILNKYLQ